MGTQAEYLEAIDHLPAGANLILPAVEWDEYERLLDNLVDHPGLRISYDEGTLEIVSTSAEHEEYKDFFLRLAQALAEERGIALETRGSTTWKRRVLRKGAEPDTCFYVANATRIIGKRTIDLESDPPPDIVVEIDITRKSLDKFSIYAAFCVLEFWRYDRMAVQFYELIGHAYREITESRFFHGVNPALLTEALEQSKREGQTVAIEALRRRLRTEP